MPGYYIHFATANKKNLKNRSFVCGLEMPDLLKHYLKKNGIEGAKLKYDKLKTPDMPDFSYFEKRLLEKEEFDRPTGMHYGSSSKPDIKFFWNSLTKEEKSNPFFLGYLWHLLGDHLIYKKLNLTERMKQNIKLENSDVETETDILHTDWDKINNLVKNNYPYIIIPKEICNLSIISFIKEGKTKYANWHVIKESIDYLKQFDIANLDTDVLIEEVLNR